MFNAAASREEVAAAQAAVAAMEIEMDGDAWADEEGIGCPGQEFGMKDEMEQGGREPRTPNLTLLVPDPTTPLLAGGRLYSKISWGARMAVHGVPHDNEVEGVPEEATPPRAGTGMPSEEAALSTVVGTLGKALETGVDVAQSHQQSMQLLLMNS